MCINNLSLEDSNDSSFLDHPLLVFMHFEENKKKEMKKIIFFLYLQNLLKLILDDL